MSTPIRPRQTLLLVSVLLGGCSISPTLTLFGAAFPDWLFCIVGGVAGTTLLHSLPDRCGLRRRLGPLALSYPVITALFAMSLWLALFHR